MSFVSKLCHSWSSNYKDIRTQVKSRQQETILPLEGCIYKLRYICVQPTELGSNFSFKHQFALINHTIYMNTNRINSCKPQSLRYFFRGLFFGFLNFLSLKTSFVDLNEYITFVISI